jgi:minor extracellular protease Epr
LNVAGGHVVKRYSILLPDPSDMTLASARTMSATRVIAKGASSARGVSPESRPKDGLPARSRPPKLPKADERGIIAPVVVDDDAAMFAALTPTKVRALRKKGLILNEEVACRMMRLPPSGRVLTPPRRRGARLAEAGGSPPRTLSVKCVDAETGHPVAGAAVDVIVKLGVNRGYSGTTGPDGVYQTILPNSAKTLAEVAVAPLFDYWSARSRSVPVSQPRNELTLRVYRVAPDHSDPHDRLLAAARTGGRFFGTGRGIRVAVIDGGLEAPLGLRHVAGMNTTEIEDPSLLTDNGTGHGTHVATTIWRLAPDVEFIIYRAFPNGSTSGWEGSVTKALRQAEEAGCHLVNLSLGLDNAPSRLQVEVRRAMNAGILCIASAGNEWGANVVYPARYPEVIAVSATGVRGTWPAAVDLRHLETDDPPPREDTFFAAFSNRGEAVDAIAPGVAILSHVDGTRRGVMDGTSMSAPFVTGTLAALLSADLNWMAMAPDVRRYRAARAILDRSLRQIGFGATFEGRGQPSP